MGWLREMMVVGGEEALGVVRRALGDEGEAGECDELREYESPLSPI